MAVRCLRKSIPLWAEQAMQKKAHEAMKWLSKWAVLACLAAASLAATGASGSGYDDGQISASAASGRLAIADFDGDSRPDTAQVGEDRGGATVSNYWIDVRISGGARQGIGIQAPAGGLQIVSRDVNGDNAIDLVVSTAWLHEPVAVLLNDGRGNFALRDPAEFSKALLPVESGGAQAKSEIQDRAAAMLRRMARRVARAREEGARGDTGRGAGVAERGNFYVRRCVRPAAGRGPPPQQLFV